MSDIPGDPGAILLTRPPSADLTVDNSRVKISMDGPGTSITPQHAGLSFVMKESESGLKLMQAEIFVCAKGHYVRGFDVSYCPVCEQEWKVLAFPVSKKLEKSK